MLFHVQLSIVLFYLVDCIRAQATFSEATGLFSVSVKIPESTSKLDNGDVDFTIQAPANKGWTAVGIGGTMAGSLIFVLYPGSGNNVTVSQRLGRGEMMPEYYAQTNIQMQDGTGIASALMTAIFTCQNCKRWLNGKLDITATDQDWIYASNPTDTIRTDDRQATIQRHSDSGYGTFTMDMTKAVVPDAQASTPATSNPATPISGSTGSLNGQSSLLSKKNTYIIVHAVLMGFSFILLFPFGALIIRMLRHLVRRVFYLHVVTQLGGFVIVIVAIAMGIRASSITLTHFKHSHQILGIVVFSLLIPQIVLGATHHMIFIMKGKRSWVAHAHKWFGRFVILLGIINGGLGLPLANASTGAIAIYSGAAAVVFIFWLLAYGATRFWEHKTGANKKPDEDEDENMPTPTIYQPPGVASSYEMKSAPAFVRESQHGYDHSNGTSAPSPTPKQLEYTRNLNAYDSNMGFSPQQTFVPGSLEDSPQVMQQSFPHSHV